MLYLEKKKQTIQSSIEDNKAIISQTEDFCYLLAEILNEIHQVRYSKRFWTFLTFSYVFQFLIYWNYTKSESDNKFLSKNNTSKSSLYQLISVGVKKIIFKINYLVYSQRLSTYSSFIYGFSYSTKSLNDRGSTLPNFYPIIIKKKESVKRLEIKKVAEKQKGDLEQKLIENIPASFVEYFIPYMDSIKLYDPSKKKFHISIIDDDFMKVFFAKYIENGAKINRYQHGSHYGEQINMEYGERLTADEFHTWGWKICEKDVPDEAFRLEGFKLKYNRIKPQRDNLLICLPAISFSNKNTEWVKVDNLLESIDYKKYPNVVLRPRPTKKFYFNIGREKFISRKNKNISAKLSNTTIVRAIANSILTIHLSSPSTTFLECIYVDHPIMAVFHNNRPTEIVMPYYEFFFDKKVYHENIDSLVEHLNEINIAEWWNEVISHPVYKEFKNKFTNNGSHLLNNNVHFSIS